MGDENRTVWAGVLSAAVRIVAVLLIVALIVGVVVVVANVIHGPPR